MPHKLKIEMDSPHAGSVFFGRADGELEELMVSSLTLRLEANKMPVATVELIAFEVDALVEIVNLFSVEVLTPLCIHCQTRLVRHHFKDDDIYAWLCACESDPETDGKA